MKQLFLLFAFLPIALSCSSQNNTRHYDSLVRKGIERFTAHPDCDACNIAGVVLVKLFKANDSIQIKVLYASEEMYNSQVNQDLPKRFNKKYKDSFLNKYSVLIPIYFRYEKADGDPPEVSREQKTVLKKQLKKYGRKIHVIEPVTIMGYAPVR